ncbi:MAG: S46 family peptidase [Acidobacteriota bacterium]
MGRDDDWHSGRTSKTGFWRMSAHLLVKPITSVGLALSLSLAPTTLARERQEHGRLWTFENPPLAHLEEKHGFRPDQEWMSALRLGSLRLGGEDVSSLIGSASFVSPKGLIMTSSRCVLDAVALTLDAVGPIRKGDPPSLIKTGFVAGTPKQEMRLRSGHDEWLTAAQLVTISNVTDKINRGVLPDDDEAQAKTKREANERAILDVVRKTHPKLVPQVVSFHQGAVFQLYRYKTYDDVRLVILPHVQVARFGGDPDGVAQPHLGFDFAFLRAYEDGKPANTSSQYFEWKAGGARKSELVFVSGNPSTTKRLLTKAQLELERDVRLPLEIEWLTNRSRIFGEVLGDPRRNLSSAWFSAWSRTLTHALELESGLKAACHRLQGLSDAVLMARKTTAEETFQGLVMADQELAETHGDLRDQLAGVARERRQHEVRAHFQLTGNLALLNAALTIVQACDPAETEERRKQLKREMEDWRSGGGIPNGLATALFVDHVTRARGWLPEDDPYFSKVLGGRSAQDFLKAVHETTDDGKLRTLVQDADRSRALVDSGWKAIRASEDPVIVAARELVVLMRANEKLGAELDARESALSAELGRVLLAHHGTTMGSDGTTTPRFSDGVVLGAPGSSTTFHDLYARNTELDGERVFKLPKLWTDRKAKIDMTKPVTFLSTNDIAIDGMALEANHLGGWSSQHAGGSSGSVVVNEDLEVVGLVIGGTADAFHGELVFRDDLPRSVSLHVDAIMEALMKVYDAHHVARELTGK